MGEHPIELTVVHPTAATPQLYNHFAAPYMFMVTDVPSDFAKWLVQKAIHPVQSELKILFALNGEPTPCDYVLTLSNYNLPTDNEYQKDWAKTIVQRSVIRTLFDEDSETSKKVAGFIDKIRDNVPPHLSSSEAFQFIRETVKVDVLEVFVPGTRILTPVYNIYIHPPTQLEEGIKRWKNWIENQRFYAGRYGVGMKYNHSFNCNHCKSIDHPSGLCPYTKNVPNPTIDGNSTTDDDIFPPDFPLAPPATSNTGQGRNRTKDTKGKGKMADAPNVRPEAAKPGTSTSRTNPKKRKLN